MLYRRLALLVALLHAESLLAAVVEKVANVDGYDRYWVEYVPDGLVDPVAVVLALHPGVSNAANFESSSGWDAVADEHGFVVVYPQVGSAAGVNGAWSAWAEIERLTDRSDVAYLDAVINSTLAAYGLNNSTLFMTGFSSGAQMVNVYAMVGDQRPRAIAPVSGGWADAYGVPSTELPPMESLPVWIWRGSEEDPVTGTPGNELPRSLQDQLQLAFWLDVNGSDSLPATTEQVDVTATLSLPFGDFPWSGVHTTSYYTGGDAEVRFTEVTRSNHVYKPGAAERLWEEFFSPLLPASTLPGDFNGDGRVDAADYAVWRDGLGVNFEPSQHQIWVDNYGVTVNRLTEPMAAVPEPKTSLLAAALALGGLRMYSRERLASLRG